MRRVVVESPYGAATAAEIERNVRYARACLTDCLRRGEAPLASHLLYTQPGVLNDAVSDERERGMRAGFAWTEVAELIAVYTDLGVSRGMWDGIGVGTKHRVAVEYRTLADFVA